MWNWDRDSNTQPLDHLFLHNQWTEAPFWVQAQLTIFIFKIKGTNYFDRRDQRSQSAAHRGRRRSSASGNRFSPFSPSISETRFATEPPSPSSPFNYNSGSPLHNIGARSNSCLDDSTADFMKNGYNQNQNGQFSFLKSLTETEASVQTQHGINSSPQHHQHQQHHQQRQFEMQSFQNVTETMEATVNNANDADQGPTI